MVLDIPAVGCGPSPSPHQFASSAPARRSFYKIKALDRAEQDEAPQDQTPGKWFSDSRSRVLAGNTAVGVAIAELPVLIDPAVGGN